MTRKIIYGLKCFILMIFVTSTVYGQDSNDYLLSVAENALAEENYEMALNYYQIAEAVAQADSPQAKKITDYINLIKRKLEGKIEDISEITTQPATVEEPRVFKANTADKKFKPIVQKEIVSSSKTTGIRAFASDVKGKASKLIGKNKFVSSRDIGLQNDDIDLYIEKNLDGMVFDFDKEAIERFPIKVVVRPDLHFFVKSNNLKRFLAVSPEAMLVERVSAEKLKISAIGYGKSVVHVWTDKGRMTISAVVKKKRVAALVNNSWIPSKGFKFVYGVNSSSFYRGENYESLEKATGSVRHSLSAVGPISLGDFSMSLTWLHNNGETDLSSVSAKITNGSLWFLDNFSLAAFDISSSLSALSSPGTGLRGYRFSTPILNEKVEYDIFWGKERDSIYGSLSSGVTTNTIDAYLEGAKVTYRHNTDHNYSLNVVKGYGDDRNDDLPDKVYALEAKNTFGKLKLSSEIASDTDRKGGTFRMRYKMARSNFSMTYKNIEDEYQTISGRAPGAGDISINMDYSFRPNDSTNMGMSMTAYRNRSNVNDNDSNKFNHTLSGHYSHTFDNNIRFSNSMSYTATPNSTYEYKSWRNSMNVFKQIKMKYLPRDILNATVGYTYGRSDYGSTGSYSRSHSVNTNINIPLMRSLSAFVNYNYSWLTDEDTDGFYSPRVCTAGITSNYRINRKLSSNLRVAYRNEENTDAGNRSSLSGQDYLEISAGLNYNPTRNVSLFLSGSTRNVWAERANMPKYTDANIRMGSRISWDSFITWAPKTKIKGYVFLDKNGNGVRDDGEGGIGDVAVVVGPNQVVTNEDGSYESKIRAQRTLVSVNIATIPSGYVFTTTSAQELKTARKKELEMNFGLSPQSGVGGVVFYDVNGNSKFDKTDIPVPMARVFIDGKKVARSNHEGLYYFPNAVSGTHTLMLDMSSIPDEYLPATRLKTSFEITEGITYMHYFPLRKK